MNETLRPVQVVEIIRSASFGGLVAAGIGIILYFRYPGYFKSTNLYWFITVCAAAGTGLHQAIERSLRLVFKTPFQVVTFNEKLQELDRLREDRRINDTTYQHLVNKLCERQFLE